MRYELISTYLQDFLLPFLVQKCSKIMRFNIFKLLKVSCKVNSISALVQCLKKFFPAFECFLTQVFVGFFRQSWYPLAIAPKSKRNREKRKKSRTRTCSGTPWTRKRETMVRPLMIQTRASLSECAKAKISGQTYKFQGE